MDQKVSKVEIFQFSGLFYEIRRRILYGGKQWDFVATSCLTYLKKRSWGKWTTYNEPKTWFLVCFSPCIVFFCVLLKINRGRTGFKGKTSALNLFSGPKRISAQVDPTLEKASPP